MKKTRKKGSPVLAGNIKRMRGAKGWSQALLAEKANLTDGAIKMIETSARWPKQKTLQAIADALGVEVSELLVSGEPTKYPEVIQPGIVSKIDALMDDLKVVRQQHSNSKLMNLVSSLANLTESQLDVMQSQADSLQRGSGLAAHQKSKTRGQK